MYMDTTKLCTKF